MWGSQMPPVLRRDQTHVGQIVLPRSRNREAHPSPSRRSRAGTRDSASSVGNQQGADRGPIAVPEQWLSRSRCVQRRALRPPLVRKAALTLILGMLAVICAGLFAGAALYVTAVEHPARLSCGSALALREFAPSYRLGTRLQA